MRAKEFMYHVCIWLNVIQLFLLRVILDPSDLICQPYRNCTFAICSDE